MDSRWLDLLDLRLTCADECPLLGAKRPPLTNLSIHGLTLLPSVGLTIGTTARSEKNGVFQPLLAEEAVISEPVSAAPLPCYTGKYREIRHFRF